FLHRDDTGMAGVRYDNLFGAYADTTFSYLGDVQVAAYVQAHTQPNERIYIFGYDPLIYLLSGRQSASRFIYSLPLMSDWAPAAWQDEFVADIVRTRPTYIALQYYEGAARW